MQISCELVPYTTEPRLGSRGAEASRRGGSVQADDFGPLDAAFFAMNGIISLAFMVFVIADTVA